MISLTNYISDKAFDSLNQVTYKLESWPIKINV
ncbi:hypothetical protein RCH19_002093 [Flavobacterium sp. PL12]